MAVRILEEAKRNVKILEDSFDPEGFGFDKATSIASGDTGYINPEDNKLHFGSLDPRTGMVLKGRQHKTWNLMEEEETIRGNKIIKKDDGRYYSVSKQEWMESIQNLKGTSTITGKSRIIEPERISHVEGTKGIIPLREITDTILRTTPQDVDKFVGDIVKSNSESIKKSFGVFDEAVGAVTGLAMVRDILNINEETWLEGGSTIEGFLKEKKIKIDEAGNQAIELASKDWDELNEGEKKTLMNSAMNWMTAMKRISPAEVVTSFKAGERPFSSILESKAAKEPVVLVPIKGRDAKIDISKMKTTGTGLAKMQQFEGNFTDLIQSENFERAFPSIKEVKVNAGIYPEASDSGHFDPARNEIVIDAKTPRKAIEIGVHERTHFTEVVNKISKGNSYEAASLKTKEIFNKNPMDLMSVEKDIDGGFNIFHKLTGDNLGWAETRTQALKIGMQEFDKIFKVDKEGRDTGIRSLYHPTTKRIYELTHGEELARMLAKQEFIELPEVKRWAQWNNRRDIINKINRDPKISVSDLLKDDPFLVSDIKNSQNLIANVGGDTKGQFFKVMSEMSQEQSRTVKEIKEAIESKTSTYWKNPKILELRKTLGTLEDQLEVIQAKNASVHTHFEFEKMQEINKVLKELNVLVDEELGVIPTKTKVKVKKLSESERKVDETISKITGEEPELPKKSEADKAKLGIKTPTYEKSFQDILAKEPENRIEPETTIPEIALNMKVLVGEALNKVSGKHPDKVLEYIQDTMKQINKTELQNAELSAATLKAFQVYNPKQYNRFLEQMSDGGKTIQNFIDETLGKKVKTSEILGERGQGAPIPQHVVETLREEFQKEIGVALSPETFNQVKIDLEFGMAPPEISAKHGLSGDAIRVIGEKLYEERWRGQEGSILNPVAVVKTLGERFKNWVKPQSILDISTKEGLEAMQRHHRNIRDIEFSAMQLRKGFDKLEIPESRQAIITHALEQPEKYLKELSPIEQNIYSYLKQARDEFSKLVKDSGILASDKVRENYMFHWWIDPKSGQPYSTSFGRFSKNAPQLKERTYQTLEEGMMKGQMPASLNPAELIQMSATSIVRAIQTRDMLKSLNSIETGMGEMMRSAKSTEMKPLRLIENWSQLQDQGQTSHYTRYSHPTLDKPIIYKDAAGNIHMLKGDIGVAKEIFPWVRDYFDNPTYGMASKLNFASKSLKLMSGFHVISLTMQGVAGGKGLGRLPIYNVIKGLKQIERSGDALGILYRNGLELKGYSDIGSHYDSGFKYLDKLGRVGTTAKQVLEGVQKFTFDVVHPGIKTNTSLAIFDDMVNRQQSKLGRILTDAEKDNIGKETVNYVNRLFSGEDYKSAMLQSTEWMAKHFYSPEARKAWQSFLISPQWQKAHLGMVGDIIKSFGVDKNLIQSKYYRKYLYSAAAIYGATNLYNFAMTKHMDGEGHMMWENAGDNSFSVRAPWNNPDGSPVYVKPLKSIFEVPELINMPITIKNGKLQAQFPINLGKIVSKLSPWITAIGKQAAYWKTYKEVANPNPKRLWDFMVDIGAPMAITGVGQEKKATASKVLGVVGIPTSSVKEEKTPFQEMKATRRKERKERKKENKGSGVRILD